MCRNKKIAALVLGCALAAGALWIYERCFSPVEAGVALNDLSRREKLSFAAFGDAGSGRLGQWQVSHALEKIAERSGLDFVALLGDNFYGSGVKSIHDWQWLYKFEHMYSGPRLNQLPFYAVLGNHDYDGNWQAQIDYGLSKQGSARWHMPALHYRKDFGSVNGRPLLRMVFLDTNGELEKNPEKMAEQARFVEQEMQAEPEPIWRVVAAHHPVRNDGKHGDTEELVAQLLPALKKAKVDLYVSGHDHNLQFMQRPGEPAYVISGGGGGTLYKICHERGDFIRKSNGFARVAVNAEELEVQFYNSDGDLLSGFTRERNPVQTADGLNFKPDA